MDSLGITFRAHNRCLRNAVRRDMRVSVPIDSSDAKATSSGDTTRRDGFGTPHAGANPNVSNGPTDARSTNRRIMALALPTFVEIID